MEQIRRETTDTSKTDIRSKKIVDKEGGASTAVCADTKATSKNPNSAPDALLQAVEHGDLQRIKKLLESDFDAINNYPPTFHIAVMRTRHRIEIFKLLLDYRAIEINASDANCWTSLHLAAYNGSDEIASLLLTRGAHVNAKDLYGLTALYFAAGRGSVNCARILIENGANINSRNNHGRTALHWASACNQAHLVELLIDSGAEVNVTEYLDWQTPFHWACYNGCIGCAEILIHRGADIKIEDKNHRTTLESAKTCHEYDVNEHFLGVDVRDMAYFSNERGAYFHEQCSERFAVKSGIERDSGLEEFPSLTPSLMSASSLPWDREGGWWLSNLKSFFLAEKLHANYMCVLCKGLAWRPWQMLDCGHVYCEQCALLTRLKRS